MYCLHLYNYYHELLLNMHGIDRTYSSRVKQQENRIQAHYRYLHGNSTQVPGIKKESDSTVLPLVLPYNY